MGFGSKYEKIKCPDGSVRLVLKDPTHIPEIFAIQVSEWHARIQANIQATNAIITAGGGTDISKAARTILDDLSTLEKAALQRYTAAYMHYTTNPCANDKLLNANLERINESIDRLQELDVEIKKLQQAKETTPDVLKYTKPSEDPTEISEKVHQIVGGITQSLETQKTFVEQPVRDLAPDELYPYLANIKGAKNELARRRNWSRVQKLAHEARIWRDDGLWDQLKYTIIVDAPSPDFGDAIQLMKVMIMASQKNESEDGRDRVLKKAREVFLPRIQEMLLDASVVWNDHRWNLVQIADLLLKEGEKFRFYWSVFKKGVMIDDDDSYTRFFGVVFPYLVRSKIHDSALIENEINDMMNSHSANVQSRALGISNELGLS